MGMVRFILVADTDAQAMRIARSAYLRWRSSFTYLSDLHGVTTQSPLQVDSFDTLVRQGQGIAGSPETVRDFLASQIAECGVNYVVGQFCFGNLTLEHMLHSVEIFASQVMPALRSKFDL